MSSPSPSPSTKNAEFLLSLSAPPDRVGGPRIAPSEAELLIDPAFYSFLSGVTVVLLLFSFSYIIAYATLSTVRQRQYRKYRQKRRRLEERAQLARGAASSSSHPTPLLSPAPSPHSPSPVFVGSLRPLSSSSSFSLPLYRSSPSFLSNRRSLPALFRPVASALAAASASSPAQLPRFSLSFTSPSALSDHVRAILTPRARTPAEVPFSRSSFTSPPTSANGASRTSQPTSYFTSTQRGLDHVRKEPNAAAAVNGASSGGRGEVALSSIQQDELEAAQDEHNRGFLSFSLSTFLLTIALLWLALLSLTLTLSTPRLTSHWLLAWLTNELVTSLWTLVSILTSLSLFLIAPFAYLYYEAEGLVFFPFPTFLTSTGVSLEEDESYRAFLPRFVETIIVLCFFSVMLYGSFHLLHCIIYHLPLLALSWQRWSVLESLWSLTSLSFSFSLSSLFSPALLSNVTHFVPGLLICLFHSHSGFSSLLSSAFSLRVPFYYAHHLQRQRDMVEVKLIHARLLLSSASSHSRRMLLASRVQSLELRAKVVDAELHPPLLSLSSFPVLRNALWFGLSVFCLLLVWHVMVRVMQREARLMMHSIDELLSSDGQGEGEARGVVAFLLTLIVSALRYLLRGMKHAINGLLFTLGMIRRRDMEGRSVMAGPALLSSFPLSLPSASLVLEVWSDVLRLLSSFLLGQNGFRQPVSSLLFDGLVANFFCLSCTIGLYRMALMKPYSPFSTFASTANAAFARGDEEQAAAAATAADGDQSTDHQLASLRASSASVLPASAPVGASAAPSSALHSAQFFVVNTTVLLLLACSFPFSLWLLGLSSFDLPHFYPSARELSTGLFIHTYNLAFIVLSARQGAALWLKMLWFLVKTSYSSLHALLMWLLPSLWPSLPSPSTVAALPSLVRAHPKVAQLSFLLSWRGLYWAVRSVTVPILRLLWVLVLYLLRVLVLSLRLCARNLYYQVLSFIQQQLREHPVPLVNRRAEKQRVEQGQLKRATSRLRGMDEERTPAAAAAPAQLKAEAVALLGLRSDEEESKAHEPSLQLQTANLHSPPLSSISSSPPLPRVFSPTKPLPLPLSLPSPHSVHLVAPRPLHLAAAVSLGALNAEQPDHSPELYRRSSSNDSFRTAFTRSSSHTLSRTPPSHPSPSSSFPVESPTPHTTPPLAPSSPCPSSPSPPSAPLPPAPQLDSRAPSLSRRAKRRLHAG